MSKANTENQKRKLVYVMGAGRSGSTLLGILLGNEPGIFCAGELTRFPKREGTPPNIEQESEVSKFWKGFKLDLEKAIRENNDFYEKLNDLSITFEHHSGFLSSYFGLGKTKNKLRYKKFLTSFWDILFSKVDEQTIVDTSKYPARILNIDSNLDYELCVIHIVRNPIGVLRSFEKEKVEQPPKHWIGSLVYYFTVSFFCQLAIRKLTPKHKVVTIRYEDLIQTPRKTITKISENTGLDFPVVDDKLKKDELFETGKLFDGNRIRLKNKIELRTKYIGVEASNLREKIMYAVNGFWWRKKDLKE